MPSQDDLQPFPTAQQGDLENPDCSLSSWNRPIPLPVIQALSAWAERDAPRVESTVHEPNGALRGVCSGLPRAASAWLKRDVRALLRLLFDVSRADAVTLRFGVVHSDLCRKFHIDYLRYRLITTYVGPGTEWVPNVSVNRNVLASPPPDADQANSLIIKHPSAIRRAAPGEVLLMKGANHPHGLGLVHRSPPVEHLGVRRLVLVLSVHR